MEHFDLYGSEWEGDHPADVWVGCGYVTRRGVRYESAGLRDIEGITLSLAPPAFIRMLSPKLWTALLARWRTGRAVRVERR
jgi:hypothetical protein